MRVTRAPEPEQPRRVRERPCRAAVCLVGSHPVSPGGHCLTSSRHSCLRPLGVGGLVLQLPIDVESTADGLHSVRGQDVAGVKVVMGSTDDPRQVGARVRVRRGELGVAVEPVLTGEPARARPCRPGALDLGRGVRVLGQLDAPGGMTDGVRCVTR